ncbi:RTC4-like domain-containing protein [Xylaria bambusicola]|uniref:RTC4-like domain-containing protein n=1 Tax=Xylaria bambusicola TaxID=326684 RepID=UPI0020084078|nr:RTC4-like domain-containing protein [Xylaria bambusicola]KAI0523774.1 RTC4-like domain-containing protein [Xylaria bambusicola]
MTKPRSGVLRQRRVGIDRRFPPGAPLTQVGGKDYQPTKRQKVGLSSVTMKRDGDPLYDPITAPPESSDDEAESPPKRELGIKDEDDSDEEYNRVKAANIRGTTFDNKEPKLGAQHTYRGETESKQCVAERQSVEPNQLERELEAPRERKKKPSRIAKYGEQTKPKRSVSSQTKYSTSRGIAEYLASDDDAQPPSSRNSFHRVKSISPMKSQSPRKTFKTKRQISELDEPEESKPRFKSAPQHDLSPLSTPRKRRMSSVDEAAESKDEKAVNRPIKGLRGRIQRKGSKRDKPLPDPVSEEASQRPVFRVPGLEDLDLFDDTSSLGATTAPIESQDTSWDQLDLEETEAMTVPRCPMCHQEVDRELLQKYSTDGKMSVKQQTAFCRLHKRKSAAKAGTEKGYPNITWDTLDSRLRSHKNVLQRILEGTQASHYRKILKERVDSGKSRTLLTSNDNLTPGYYGPKGLQVMTQFIMRTLSDVLRRRAVEDKLISARSYTGYVQTVLVPELTVRLIMEDMSVGEERARDVLEESVEIGELLHDEDRDVVMINELEEDLAPEV